MKRSTPNALPPENVATEIAAAVAARGALTAPRVACAPTRRPEIVRLFLAEHEPTLHARVLREVRNKLNTGLKNPRPRGGE